MRWRCGVCGGPVVPSEGNVARSGGELASLVAAQRLRAMSMGWLAAAVVLAAVGVMGGGLALLLWIVSHVSALVLGVVAGGAGALAAWSLRRSRARGAEVARKLDDAWELVAGEVLRARGGEMTSADLARVMRTDEAHAEALLARLSVGGRARVAVRDDAELAYRVADDDGEAALIEAQGEAERARGRPG
jgi:hypothetical protein